MGLMPAAVPAAPVNTKLWCHRGASALLLSMMVLSQSLLASALLSPQQLGEPRGAHAIVFSPAGFVESLQNVVVSRIHVTENLFMSEDAWPPHPIRITRNITIDSTKDDQRLINYTRVWGKVLVEPGVHLLFKNIVMAGLSIGSSITFIAASPGAIVAMQGGAWKAPVCPPYGSNMMSLMVMHPRSPGYPGQQRLGRMSRPFCINHVCYQHAFVIHDWASSQPLEQDELELGAYTALFTDIVWACDVVFTDKCVAQKGYEICRKEMLSLHLRGMSDTYDNSKRALAVGCAVVAVIAAFLAASLMTLRGAASKSPPCRSETIRADSFKGSEVKLEQSAKQAFSDHVQLGQLLGAGSFGSVFQGSWQGRSVAVKVIPHDRQTSKQISNEASVSLAAIHPNVVRTFHHFTVTGGDLLRNLVDSTPDSVSEAHAASNGSRFTQFSNVSNNNSFMCMNAPQMRTCIVLELCDQGALPGHLAYEAAQGTIDNALALAYALDVAQGMAYLHQHHICHGDLKASNTLVTSSPSAGERAVCKISDFGVSRVLSGNRTHLSTNTIGTVTHMPPELLLDGVLTKQCDMYSYGILLWEIVSAGQRMYGKLNPAQIIEKVAVRNERPEFSAHVPLDYARLAEDCWQANEYARPSFTEVVVRLQGMLQRAASSRARVPRSQSRRRDL